MKLDNEEVIAEALERRGVRIVFPEEHSIQEQLKLFDDHTCFAGLVGSAFHTAAFVKAKRLLIVNYKKAVSSNQSLIDKAGRHTSLYLYPNDIVQHEIPGFTIGYSLTKPQETAEAMLRAMDAFVGKEMAA